MTIFKKMAGISVLAVALSASAGVASALDKKPTLDLKTAQTMAAACLAHQEEKKYAPINVAIVDDGGNTIVLNRQDGACKACEAIAINKAKTAALFNNTTRDFERLSYGDNKDGVGAELPGISLVPGLIAFPGGLPIQVNGVPIGGIGVSGASGDEDEQCAFAAIGAVESLLN